LAVFFAALRGAAFFAAFLAVFFAALRGAAFFAVFFAVFFAALRGAAFFAAFLRAVFFATATMPPVSSDPCALQGTIAITVTEQTRKYKDIGVYCQSRVA
jgi:hypothetical protein